MLCAMPFPPSLDHAVDHLAAARWLRRTPTAAPWLHGEVARRMAARLPAIRLPVQRWAHWLPALGDGGREVAAHYPHAECVSAPPASNVQLVWANMLAHAAPDAPALLAAWHGALADGGFLMFSCLGPDTLLELRALYAALGWPPPAHAFTDMHDWGDALLEAGFADPVMDMERITLTFTTPQRLLNELRGLGRNLHPARFAALRTPRWRERLLAALEEHLRGDDGALALTFEIIYGHAIKTSARDGHTIPLADVRRALRRAST